ncbi:hypothetical protein P9246_07930 [Aeribacillus pallidus]|nr:hypothetical protein [Aeribacillus pallidus]
MFKKRKQVPSLFEKQVDLQQVKLEVTDEKYQRQLAMVGLTKDDLICTLILSILHIF